MIVSNYGSLWDSVTGTVSAVEASLRQQLAQAQAEAAKWQAEAKRIQAQVAGAVDIARNPAGQIQWLKLRTAYGPDVLIDQPFARRADSPAGAPAGPPQPGQVAPPPQPLWRLLQPTVEMKLTPLATPVTLAPWGVAPPTKWPLLSTTAALGVGFLLILAVRGATR